VLWNSGGALQERNTFTNCLVGGPRLPRKPPTRRQVSVCRSSIEHNSKLKCVLAMAPFARAKSCDVDPVKLTEILVKSCYGEDIPQLLPGIPDYSYSKVSYIHRVS
jgi:hypothetical protein